MPEAMTIGVDIGGTKVAAGLVNSTGEISHKTRAPMVATGDAATGFVDVKAAVGSLSTANPARIAALTEELETKKKTLVAATAVAASGAQPVAFPADAKLDVVKTTANTALQQSSQAAGPGGLMVLICIFAFIAAHAVGQGTVIWVLISEIFPNRHRAHGQALGSLTHWTFAALLTTFFPSMVTAFAPGYVFLFFCGMMVLQLLWVKLMVPETKGVPLEEIEHRLTGTRSRNAVTSA